MTRNYMTIEKVRKSSLNFRFAQMYMIQWFMLFLRENCLYNLASITFKHNIWKTKFVMYCLLFYNPINTDIILIMLYYLGVIQCSIPKHLPHNQHEEQIQWKGLDCTDLWLSLPITQIIIVNISRLYQEMSIFSHKLKHALTPIFLLNHAASGIRRSSCNKQL